MISLIYFHFNIQYTNGISFLTRINYLVHWVLYIYACLEIGVCRYCWGNGKKRKMKVVRNSVEERFPNGADRRERLNEREGWRYSFVKGRGRQKGRKTNGELKEKTKNGAELIEAEGY